MLTLFLFVGSKDLWGQINLDSIYHSHGVKSVELHEFGWDRFYSRQIFDTFKIEDWRANRRISEMQRVEFLENGQRKLSFSTDADNNWKPKFYWKYNYNDSGELVSKFMTKSGLRKGKAQQWQVWTNTADGGYTYNMHVGYRSRIEKGNKDYKEIKSREFYRYPRELNFKDSLYYGGDTMLDSIHTIIDTSDYMIRTFLSYSENVTKSVKLFGKDTFLTRIDSFYNGPKHLFKVRIENGYVLSAYSIPLDENGLPKCIVKTEGRIGRSGNYSWSEFGYYLKYEFFN
ncbi:MAG: hypothetical protein KDC92_05895 [Bacteroidetes bacterium]|nr:hypothetical protein [Bacteroidota bacterium]